MMKRKRIVSALILAVGFNLIGCGNETAVYNESVVDNIETVEDGTEAIKESPKIEDGNVVTTDKPMSTETPKSTSTASPEPTATPKPTATPEPTAPPHVHEWTEEVTKAAGCSTEGEKKLTCDCGETKVESIPTNGNHNWVENTTVVHHEALGHVEQVQTGTTAGYTTYACNVCGAQFDTPSGVVDHAATFVGTDNNHAMTQTVAYDHPGEPVYESVWQIDQPAWDETVGTGTYTCSVCGATK